MWLDSVTLTRKIHISAHSKNREIQLHSSDLKKSVKAIKTGMDM